MADELITLLNQSLANTQAKVPSEWFDEFRQQVAEFFHQRYGDAVAVQVEAS